MIRSIPWRAGLLLLGLGAVALGTSAPSAAQDARPRRLGSFQAWTAATFQEEGHKVCYAFAAASKAEGVQNRPAANVQLMVVLRPGRRELPVQVSVRPAYTYPAQSNDAVKLAVGTAELPFYVPANSRTAAFARDSQAAVQAFRGGRDVTARGPAPGGRGQATDVFPLGGFSQAYDAMLKECPMGGAPRR